MANITLKNSADAGNTSGTTDLTGYNFTNNPLIGNFSSRDDFPGDDDFTAVPAGLQENFSLITNGLTQFVEGNLDPGTELLITGDTYTLTGWVKFTNWGNFDNAGLAGDEYRELINSRYVSGTGPGVYRAGDDIVNTEPGFTVSIYHDSGTDEHYWAVNINGEDVQTDNVDITLNTWYWFALVKDASEANFYVTDTAFNSSDPAILFLDDSGAGLANAVIQGPMKIAHSDTDTGYYFQTQIIDITFWNTALTTTALEEGQYTIFAPDEAETAGMRYYYRFNPEFNVIAKDANNQRNNFFLKNFAGNPYVQESPTDFGNTTYRSLRFPGNNEHLIRYDNSDDSSEVHIDRPGNFYDFSSSYTIECWVKPLALPGLGDDPVGVISKWNADFAGVSADERGFILQIVHDGVNPVFQFITQTNDPADTVTYQFDPTTPIVAGTWYWVAVVKDVTGTMDAGNKKYHFFFHKDNSGVNPNDNIVDSSAAFVTVGTETYQPTVDLLIGAEHFWDGGAADIGHYLYGNMIAVRGYQTIRTQVALETYRNQFLPF